MACEVFPFGFRPLFTDVPCLSSLCKSASSLHVARDSGETRHAGRTKTFGAFSLRGISIVGSMFFFSSKRKLVANQQLRTNAEKGRGYETTVHEVTCRQRVVSVRERGKTKLTRGLAKRGARQKQTISEFLSASLSKRA